MIESNKFHLACLNSICEGKPRYNSHQEISTSHFALNNQKKKKKSKWSQEFSILRFCVDPMVIVLCSFLIALAWQMDSY